MKWKASIYFIYILFHILIVYFPQILCERIKKVQQKNSKQNNQPVQAVEPNTCKDPVKIIKQPLIIIPIPSRFCNEKWDYNNHGDDWECECKEGKSQSPINIPSASKNSFKKDCAKTIFEFKRIQNTDEDGNTPKLVLENNIIKLKANLGKITNLDFVSYEMYEMLFHIGAEHTIDGVNYDFEAQIYYMAVTPGHIKKSAAVSILFKITPGSKNLFFEKDINILDLPDKYEREKEIDGVIDLKHIFMSDLNDKFLEFSYYKYEGSISAPPCREDTTWYVVADPIPISYTTVETFKDSIKSLKEECFNEDFLNMSENAIDSQWSDNIRHMQPFNSRDIYYYESPIKKEKSKAILRLKIIID